MRVELILRQFVSVVTNVSSLSKKSNSGEMAKRESGSAL